MNKKIPRRLVSVGVSILIVALLPPAPAAAINCATTVEDNSAYVSYAGTWNTINNPSFSGGSVHASTGPSSAAAFVQFNGTCATVVYWGFTYQSGSFQVVLDGALLETIDVSSWSTGDLSGPYQRTYTTAAGTHTIQIFGNLSGGNGPGATTYLDKLLVDSPSTVCGGSANYPVPAAPTTQNGGWPSATRSNVTSSDVSFAFVGDCFVFDYLTQPDQGIASVLLDGAVLDQIDEYANIGSGYPNKRWFFTTSGNHIATIRVSGNKNAASTGTYVHVSSFTAAAAAPHGSIYPYTFGAYANAASFGAVNAATGTFSLSTLDLALPGRTLPFGFARSYNSQDTTAGAFGIGWTHSYDLKVTCNCGGAGTYTLHRGDGRRETFSYASTDAGGNWHYAGPPGIFDELIVLVDPETGGVAGYQLVTKAQAIATFYASGLLAGRPSQILDQTGNKTSFGYDSATGLLVTITENNTGTASQRQIQLSYDAQNHITQLWESSGSLGRRVTYAYDGSGRLVTVTDMLGNAPGQNPLQHQWRYAYDGTSTRIATVTDPDGRVVVRNIYDLVGRVTQQRDGLLNPTSFSYAANQTILSDPLGHTTTIAYDSRLRLLSTSTSGISGSASYTYDSAGDRTSVRDRLGNQTDFTFDSHGNVLTATGPSVAGGRPLTQYAYDTKNNTTSVTDPLNFTSSMTYDASTSNLLSQTRQIATGTNAVTSYQYLDSANPGLATRITSPRGYNTVLTYTAKGDLASSTDPDGNKATYAYDEAGRVTSRVDPDGNVTGGVPADHTWSTTYDENDRVTRETDPLADSTVYGYDGAGHLSGVTDARGTVTTYAYDANGRLASVGQKPDPAGPVLTTTITRDANGNVVSLSEANGHVTDYAYDSLNRLVSATVHPSPGVNFTTTLALDPNGNVLTRTTADAVATSYTYDNLNRLTQISATGLATIGYGYDLGSRRTSMTDATGNSSYTYDGLSRMTTAIQPNGTLSYSYDLDSNRTSLTYPGTASVTSAYSPADRLMQLTDWASRTSTYTYKASGQVSQASYPNGMTATYTWDRAQRLTNLVNASGSTTITSHAYTLDAAGNRTALDEFVSGITATGQTDHFGLSYDGLNRLTGVTTTNPETFTLDGASNITARSSPAATYTIDGEDRPTSDGSRTLTWSNADRLTGRGTDSFSYDALDRLTSSSVAGTARSYTYNGDGLLQSRTQGSATTFLWDPASSPSRLLQVGSDRIVYGLGPLYVAKSDGTTLTIARDGQKSVRAELSGSTVANSLRYAAYGSVVQPANATPTYLGYAGQLYDPSGLYYMRARWYDSSTGRFLSRDPVRGDPRAASSLNAYAYAGGNPIVTTDPSGLTRERVDGSVVVDMFDPDTLDNVDYGDSDGGFCRDCAGPPGPGGPVGSGTGKPVESPAQPTITTPYSRPAGATTAAQREFVQDQPCIVCGKVEDTMVANHTQPLVQEYYETGRIDLEQMHSLDAITPMCPLCSARSGGQLSWYSRRMRVEYFP